MLPSGMQSEWWDGIRLQHLSFAMCGQFYFRLAICGAMYGTNKANYLKAPTDKPKCKKCLRMETKGE